MTHYYAQTDAAGFVRSVAETYEPITGTNFIQIESLDDALLGKQWLDGEFVLPPPPPSPKWEWYIDIGPFYDRFKSAKLAVLTSNDPGVRAVIADLNIRKWVDLARTDVSSALQYVGTQVPALTAELQTEILATPVADHENLALRKLYFS